MTRCDHDFPFADRPPSAGAQAACIKCHMPFIYNGTKWVWFHDLSPRERKALTVPYNIDRLTEKRP